MAEHAKAAKAENYTSEMVERLLARYEELGNDGLETIAAELGKPIGRDLALARPCAATDLGLAGAVARLKTLVAAAAQAVPPCPRADGLRDLMAHEARRFLPKGLSERLAA